MNTDIPKRPADKVDYYLAKIDAIKSQLEEARAQTAETGDYSDGDWYLRAQRALRHNQRELQKAQRELGEANRQARLATASTLERRFMTAAKARLTPDLFNDILTEAHETVASEAAP